ncbi:MAG TPA: dihydroorotate dehydrogenase electron transfer subunit [Vicinamibacterales bacterium]|nr:dihydroorotate dehydrogenase electron transfer subunit [Vicinamibacterales bacterium]
MPPIDVDATVIANRRLSRDYNVLTLSAAAVGARTRPGQFVMVRPARMTDTLLRRPFSVFEILRDANGAPTAITLLNKRAGRTTNRLYEAEPGERMACLGPLGKPYTPVAAPQEAWMVAGGVGLAPFATLAESLASQGTPARLFYGARSDQELFYLDFFERLGVTLIVTTEDGSRGERGRVTAPLDRALGSRAPGTTMIYACGPEPMLAAVAGVAERHRQPCEVSVERTMGCGLGGCYSCVIKVRDGATPPHFVRSCISGPVFNGAEIVWD